MDLRKLRSGTREMIMGVMNESALKAIERADSWLDGETGPAYKEQPLAQDWARLVKAAEEAGEAIKVMINMTGQNPRRSTGSRHDLLSEAADGAAAFLLAIQHFTKDTDKTDTYLAAALVKVDGRARNSGY
jgi:hypothetical protein